MSTWPIEARVEFVKAFESYWPCRRGQEEQRGGFMALLEQEVSHWGVTDVIRGLRHLKSVERENFMPTIPRIKEAIREARPKYNPNAYEPGGGISWEQFVQTNDWPAFFAERDSAGVDTQWMRKMLPLWRKGAPLIPSCRYLSFKPQAAVAHREREPGED